jgi:hypothetical protein
MTALFTFQNAPARMGPANREKVVKAHAGRRPWVTGYAEGHHLMGEMARFTSYVEAGFTEWGTPCFYRPDLMVLGRREEEAYPNTKVGSWGAGPPVMAQAYPHLLKVVDPEDDIEPIWYENAHLVPSIDRKAEGEAALRNRRLRRRLHKMETEKIVDNAAGLDRVVVAADWNDDPNDEAADRLRAAGFTIISDSRIDWWALRGVEVVRHGLMPKNGSDHPGIWVEVA